MSWRLKLLLSELAQPRPMKYKAALLAKAVPGLWPGAIQLNGDGVVEVREFMTLYVYREIFIDRIYDIALDTDRPTIIDVGANTGLFTLRMKQLYPAARVFAFEPYGPNFAAACRTIEANGLGECTVAQKGVGARTESRTFYVHPHNVGGHSVNRIENAKTVTVDLVSIRSVLDETGHCDLLKLDCEGAEHEIIMSLTESDASRIGRVLYEVDGAHSNAQDLRQHLSSLGFEVSSMNGMGLATRPT